MQVAYKGALTFENDEALQAGLDAINQQLATSTGLLTADDFNPIGLHLTLSFRGAGTQAQFEADTAVIHTLAATAYSGYIDASIDGDETRYHAKEIAPKTASLTDLVE